MATTTQALEKKYENEKIEIEITCGAQVTKYSFQPMNVDEPGCTVGNYIAFAINQSNKFFKKCYELKENEKGIADLVPSDTLYVYQTILGFYKETIEYFGFQRNTLATEVMVDHLSEENKRKNESIIKKLNKIGLSRSSRTIESWLGKKLTPPEHYRLIERSILPKMYCLGHYFSRFNMKEAINWWTIAAAVNNVERMLLFNSYTGRYDTVETKVKNHALALQYLKMAAKDNDKHAQFKLAWLYGNKDIDTPWTIKHPKDIKKFKEYLELAARNESSHAIHVLAKEQIAGEHYPKSLEAAVGVYKQHLKQDYEKNYYIGTCYFFYSTPPDFEKAAFYFKQVAASEDNRQGADKKIQRDVQPLQNINKFRILASTLQQFCESELKKKNDTQALGFAEQGNHKEQANDKENEELIRINIINTTPPIELYLVPIPCDVQGSTIGNHIAYAIKQATSFQVVDAESLEMAIRIYVTIMTQHPITAIFAKAEKFRGIDPKEFYYKIQNLAIPDIYLSAGAAILTTNLSNSFMPMLNVFPTKVAMASSINPGAAAAPAP